MSVCKRGLFGFGMVLVLVSIIGYLMIADAVFGNGPMSPLWGMLLGSIVGTVSCFWLRKTHIIVHGIWEPKNPDAYAKGNWLWGLPVGAMLVNVIIRFFEPAVGRFVLGGIGTWLLIFAGFIVFYSCKNGKVE
jgi:hypothetical protein